MPVTSRWVPLLVFTSVCLVVLGGMAALTLRRSGQALELLIADDARDLYVVQKLQNDSEHASRKARAFLFTGEERFLREMRETRVAIEQDLEEAHAVIDSPQGRRLLALIVQAQYASWRELEIAIEERRQGDIEEAIRRVLEDVQPHRDALDRAFAELVEYKHVRLERHHAIEAGENRFSFLLVLGLLGLTLLVTGSLGSYLRRATAHEARELALRRKAEEALRQAHARILGILEESGVAFYALDTQWRLTYVNQVAEPLLHKQREELVGRNLWEVFPEAVGTVVWHHFHRVLETRVPAHFEIWYEPLKLWAEVRAQPGAEGLSVYFLDITARKQAEMEVRDAAEKYQALTSASFDGLIIHDNGLILEANESHCRMFGYSHEEVVGSSVSRFIAPEDVEHVLRVTQSGVPVPYEASGLRKDGTRLHVEVITRYLDYRGKRVRAAAMRDITERKRMLDYEQRLLGIVGHDLRSPLAAILASVDLMLRRGTLEESQTRPLLRIRRSAERMRGLLGTLLDYTRERAGAGVPIAPVPVCIHDVGTRVLEDLRAAYPERLLECEAQGDTCGRWDPVRLEQVTTNLLDNALKYGEPGRPVRVSYRDAGAHVVFTVHNEGPPISPELLQHLFEPFRRGEQSETTVRQSAGLGLFIVKCIVKAHGGDIHVTSTPEGGTTFTVLLPRQPPAWGSPADAGNPEEALSPS
ncbi:ATP-binding protein [Hyalangium rubrum]|uniref:histidine kinase n=1 Tax=Hyalangium rubrum TaxID=3103134 RepID=A0ABU5H372_9BACT|nr:ATP-binding protein [Hyalangium sp. s54d21]MDY7226525.1 PAS domain S-box protein [Hyalangium sp. s54d21]